MVRKTLEEIPEPVILPSEEAANKRIKLKIIDFDNEIARLNLESLESSRQMIRTLDQMNVEGFQTLAALEDQDDQLDKIEQNLSKVNEDLNVVSDNVNNMERFCGCNIFKLLRSPFKKCKKREREAIKAEVLKKMTENISEHHDEAQVVFRNENHRRESTSDYMKRLTADPIENELEKNLMQIDTQMESIKHLAVDMHVQLKIQGPKLENIEELTERNDIVVEGVNEKVKKLLH